MSNKEDMKKTMQSMWKDAQDFRVLLSKLKDDITVRDTSFLVACGFQVVRASFEEALVARMSSLDDLIHEEE